MLHVHVECILLETLESDVMWFCVMPVAVQRHENECALRYQRVWSHSEIQVHRKYLSSYKWIAYLLQILFIFYFVVLSLIFSNIKTLLLKACIEFRTRRERKSTFSACSKFYSNGFNWLVASDFILFYSFISVLLRASSLSEIQKKNTFLKYFIFLSKKIMFGNMLKILYLSQLIN